MYTLDSCVECAGEGQYSAQPESGDYIILSDTWRGISLTIVDGTSRELAVLRGHRFASESEAAEYARKDMEREGFYPTLWVQYDRCDPQVYEGDAT